MNTEEIKKTEVWQLYEKGLDFFRMHNTFEETDLNYRMYNGNQWEGANLGDLEPVQYNYIETIVNYKTSTINQNLWAINYGSENFESDEFRKTADDVCKLLNKKAAKVWEKDQLDHKMRVVSDDAAINDEGIMYVNYDENTNEPLNEILDKTDVQYGNEQSSDIQTQPYILVSKRVPVSEAQEYAKKQGVKANDIINIVGDKDTETQAGDDAKVEKDDMCTMVTKMYKKGGKVYFSQSTKLVDIIKDKNTGLSLYPVAHMNWKEKKGSARGEGEVRGLIANQRELNKTLARALLSLKQCAFPQKLANTEKIANPDALDKLGAIIKTKGGQTVDDVNKIFGYVQPATMSTDVSKTINDLINITRELKNAGDIATGGINPEQASGKAILAVQQASQQPLVKQLTALKTFIEDIARIWLDMWKTYTPEGIELEEEIVDDTTGSKTYRLRKIAASIMEKLKGTVKIDITPVSAFDKYARELSLENFLKAGLLTPQRVNELKYYAEALPDNSSAPKVALLEICDKIIKDQEKIAMMDAQNQLMMQRANQFLEGTPETQANTINAIQSMDNQVA